MTASLPGYAEAAAMVLDYAAKVVLRPRRSETVELYHAAGRVLAEPVHADQDMPSFARSTRDGFACRAEEAEAHAWLRIAGSIRAGDAPAGPLPRLCAWEIMTGAAVPQGADAVAMLEHVEHEGDRVRLVGGRKLEAGENVVPRGAEAVSGAQLIP